VTATAFGYGIGSFDIAPKDDYNVDYATFIDIKTTLLTYTNFQNASLTRYTRDKICQYIRCICTISKYFYLFQGDFNSC